MVVEQVRAAYSKESQVLNNTFSLLKTLVHQYRAAVPIAPQALLTHLQVLRLHAGFTGPILPADSGTSGSCHPTR